MLLKRNKPTRKKNNEGGIQTRINAIRSKTPRKKKSIELSSVEDNGFRMKKETFDLLEKSEAKPEDEAFLQDFARQIRERHSRSGGLRETPATQRAVHVNESLKVYSMGDANGSDASGEDPASDHSRKISAGRKARSVASASSRRMQERTEPASPKSKTQQPRRRPNMTANQDLPPEGSILHLSTGQIVIFDRDVPGQRYQMALVLNPDGSLTAEGLNLRLGCEYEIIGCMIPDDVVSLHIAKVWHRPQLLIHLDRYEDANLIPGESKKDQTPPTREPRRAPGRREPTRAPERPAPGNAPPAKSRAANGGRKDAPANGQPATIGPNGTDELIEKGMRRGHHFKLNMGGKRTWDAIFWGGDGTGTLMVHKTHGDWALTRLDLSRFADKNIVFEDMMSDREIWEMKEILKRTYT